MASETEIRELYDQWRTWTGAESEAIQAGDWPRLQAAQDQKELLRLRLGEMDPGPARAGLRDLLGELLARERDNLVALQAKRQETEQQQTQLRQSRTNLRQVQRAYAPAAATAWHSYS